MASPEIQPLATVQSTQARCTTLAPFGIANIPELSSTLALSFMNMILIFMCSYTFAMWKYRGPSSSNNTNAAAPASSASADANTTVPASQGSPRQSTKASQFSPTRTSISDTDPPPAYSSGASIGSGSEPLLSPNPFSAAPNAAPETRAVVNATLLLIFHFFCILSGGFLISRLLYCPPNAPTETFPAAILWTVYAGHVVLLAVQLARWLDIFGGLYPEGKKPQWARPQTVWVVLLFPVRPILEGYSWMMGRVERYRVRLGEENEGEGVALGDMSGRNGRRGGRKGAYQRVPGEEVEDDQPR